MIEGCYIMSGVNKEETMVKVLVKLANLVEEQSAKIDLQTKQIATQSQQIAKQQKQIEELNHYVHNNLSEEEIERISCNAIRKTTFADEDHQEVVNLLNGSFDGVYNSFQEVKNLIKNTVSNQQTPPVYIQTQSSARGLF